jgi:hypothetical protein
MKNTQDLIDVLWAHMPSAAQEAAQNLSDKLVNKRADVSRPVVRVALVAIVAGGPDKSSNAKAAITSMMDKLDVEAASTTYHPFCLAVPPCY